MARFSAPLTLAEYRAKLIRVPIGDGSEFRIGRTPVTKGMWEEFCEATGFPIPWSMKINGGMKEKDRPVVVVSWNDSQKYLQWAKMTLPTVQQWELAAKRFDTRSGFAEWCQDQVHEDEIRPFNVLPEEEDMMDMVYGAPPPLPKNASLPIMRATRGWPIWASSWDWQDARRYDLGFRAIVSGP